jgi:hypothetical protein
MRKARLLATAFAVFCLGVGAIACSDDDADEPGPNHGTCDLRSVQSTCIERKGTPSAITDQKDACLGNEGSWSSDSCPTTDDLIGCCEYVYGDEFRECFYVGTTSDPEAYCASPMFEGTGVWTPAG